MQGLLATLCASLILVNPIAKLAITMDPVGVAANTWAAGAMQGALHIHMYGIRMAYASENGQSYTWLSNP